MSTHNHQLLTKIGQLQYRHPLLLSDLSGFDGDGDFIVMRGGFYFEPHGRASETWEEAWHIELPKIQGCWRGIGGVMNKCKAGVTARFKGRTAMEALGKAVEFLEYTREVTDAGRGSVVSPSSHSSSD